MLFSPVSIWCAARTRVLLNCTMWDDSFGQKLGHWRTGFCVSNHNSFLVHNCRRFAGCITPRVASQTRPCAGLCSPFLWHRRHRLARDNSIQPDLVARRACIVDWQYRVVYRPATRFDCHTWWAGKVAARTCRGSPDSGRIRVYGNWPCSGTVGQRTVQLANAGSYTHFAFCVRTADGGRHCCRILAGTGPALAKRQNLGPESAVFAAGNNRELVVRNCHRRFPGPASRCRFRFRIRRQSFCTASGSQDRAVTTCTFSFRHIARRPTVCWVARPTGRVPLPVGIRRFVSGLLWNSLYPREYARPKLELAALFAFLTACRRPVQLVSSHCFRRNSFVEQ